MYILDDAAIAAAAEAAKVAAAEAAAQAAAQAAATAGTTAATSAGGLAAESAPLLAEAPASAAPAMGLNQAMTPLDSGGFNMPPPPMGGGGAQPQIDPNTIESGFGDPTSSIQNISEGNLTKELTAPALEYSQSFPGFFDSVENIGQGDVNAELTNLGKSPDMMPGMGGNANPMSMFGGGEAPPMPAPQPLPAAPQTPAAPATPSKPGTPMSLQDKMRGAHAALRLASKLTTNKKDKQMLGLLSMSTAMGSTGGDLSDPKSLEMLNGPLEDISSGIQEPVAAPRLDKTMSPLDAPSTRAASPGPGINQNTAPATARGMGTLPPTRLTRDLYGRY